MPNPELIWSSAHLSDASSGSSLSSSPSSLSSLSSSLSSLSSLPSSGLCGAALNSETPPADHHLQLYHHKEAPPTLCICIFKRSTTFHSIMFSEPYGSCNIYGLGLQVFIKKLWDYFTTFLHIIPKPLFSKNIFYITLRFQYFV